MVHKENPFKDRDDKPRTWWMIFFKSLFISSITKKMVTNLPPQAEAQYKKVVASRSKEEKLENLKIFLSMIPEHKGTEKLRAQVKRQISKLQGEISVERRRRSSKPMIFDKGEMTVLTTMLARDKALLRELLTHIHDFGESLILESLKELKPLSTGFGNIVLSFIPISITMMDSHRYSFIQTILFKSDLILTFFDEKNMLDEFSLIKDMLKRFGIYAASKNSTAFFKALKAGGIMVVNKSRFIGEEEVKKFLMERGIESGVMYLSEFTSLYTLESSLKGLQRKNLLVVLRDHEGSYLSGQLNVPEDSIIFIEELAKNPLKIIFNASELIRIYLKPPSAFVPSNKPLLVDKEITIGELASKIHGGLSKSLKYARVWRGGCQSTPLRVNPNFKLIDEDVIELRTK